MITNMNHPLVQRFCKNYIFADPHRFTMILEVIREISHTLFCIPNVYDEEDDEEGDEPVPLHADKPIHTVMHVQTDTSDWDQSQTTQTATTCTIIQTLSDTDDEIVIIDNFM